MFKIITYITLIGLSVNFGCTDSKISDVKDSGVSIEKLEKVGADIDYGKNGEALYVEFGTADSENDTDMKYINGLPNIVVLSLTHSNIGDEGLSYIKDNKTIRELIFRNSKVTDEGLVYLYKMKQLKHIEYGDNNISIDAIRKLKSKLPDAGIYE